MVRVAQSGDCAVCEMLFEFYQVTGWEILPGELGLDTQRLVDPNSNLFRRLEEAPNVAVDGVMIPLSSRLGQGSVGRRSIDHSERSVSTYAMRGIQ